MGLRVGWGVVVASPPRRVRRWRVARGLAHTTTCIGAYDLHDVSLRVATVRDGSGRQCGARAPHRLYYAIGAARRLVVHSTRLHDVHL